ncbi:MAG: GntR family transcriptional regulator [Alphaproteobacteria bacterium]|nr:GntR family transcriptional regulator [Alphaproteobacteria bacterium]
MNPLPKTIPYHIFESLRLGIIRGIYPPGKSLREQELEGQFGSSRGPVRESLRLLELKGLAVHTPRRGFRVPTFSDKDLGQLYELRAQLECMVIDALKDQPIAEICASLRQNLDVMEVHFKNGDLDRYFDENIRFHEIMIAAAGNQPLRRVLDIINEMSLPIRYFVMSRKFSEGRSIKYHRLIIDHLKRKDFAKAKKITEVHILENLDFVRSAYAKAFGAALEE